MQHVAPGSGLDFALDTLVQYLTVAYCKKKNAFGTDVRCFNWERTFKKVVSNTYPVWLFHTIWCIFHTYKQFFLMFKHVATQRKTAKERKKRYDQTQLGSDSWRAAQERGPSPYMGTFPACISARKVNQWWWNISLLAKRSKQLEESRQGGYGLACKADKVWLRRYSKYPLPSWLGGLQAEECV